MPVSGTGALIQGAGEHTGFDVNRVAVHLPATDARLCFCRGLALHFHRRWPDGGSR